MAAVNPAASAAASAAAVSSAPVIVVRWKSSSVTTAVGYLVLHRCFHNLSCGFVSMHSSCTEDEVSESAVKMSARLAVTNPQMGGAAAGIRFDSSDPRANTVLGEFIGFISTYIKTVFVPLAGTGVEDQHLDAAIKQHVGESACKFSALASSIGHLINVPSDLSAQLAWAWDQKVNEYFTVKQALRGYIAAKCIKEIAEATGLDAASTGVAIHGFGTAGASLAWFLHQDKIAKVVAICDDDGYLVNTEGSGIDVPALLALKHANSGATLLKYANDSIAGQKQTFAQSTNAAGKKDEENLLSFVKACGPAATVFCPCGGSFRVTEEVVRKGLILNWRSVAPYKRMMVPASCKPYGKFLSKDGKEVAEDVDMSERLHQSKGTVAIPDWVISMSELQLICNVLSEKFEQSHPDVGVSILQATAASIVAFLRDAGLSDCASKNIAIHATKLSWDRVANPHTFSGPRSRAILSGGVKSDVPDYQQASAAAAAAASSSSAGESGKHPSLYALEPLAEELRLPLEERIRLCRAIAAADELISDEELCELLRRCDNPVAYDGFEPSGRMHIAQGVRKAILVNRLTKAGFTFVFWVADYFAMLNHKMGGDLKKIRRVGQYFVEVWKATGMDMSRVRFLWCSEEYSKRGDEFWFRVLDMSTKFNISRVKRCCQIMGRSEGDDLSASQILYPLMQAADIFLLGVDVCQLGVDQRKVNMLAREYCDEAKASLLRKPIIMSHNMMPGLKEGQAKMSKSDPSSAIFMEDSPAEVVSKIKKAFCPPGQVDPNPCMDYMRDIIFAVAEDKGVPFVLQRSEENGGNQVYTKFEDFSKDYAEGKLHPGDVKDNLARELNLLIEPVRRHFTENPEAGAILDDIRRWQAESAK